jgi:hypothetical protein
MEENTMKTNNQIKKQKHLEIEAKVMKEQTKEVTDNEYKEEQMRRNS